MACSLWQRAKEKYTICASSERAAKPAHACPEAAAQRAHAPRHAAGPETCCAHAPSPQSRRPSTAVSLSRAPWRAAAARAKAADPPLAAQGQPLLGGPPPSTCCCGGGEALGRAKSGQRRQGPRDLWAAQHDQRGRQISAQGARTSRHACHASPGSAMGQRAAHPGPGQASGQHVTACAFAHACAKQASGPASEHTPEGTPDCWPLQRHTLKVCHPVSSEGQSYSMPTLSSQLPVLKAHLIAYM